jgi:hypothetical protein
MRLWPPHNGVLPCPHKHYVRRALRVIVRIPEFVMQVFVAAFGSKVHFIIGLGATRWWLWKLHVQGFQHWNTGRGRAGNNYESTAEYFLEVAILYVSGKTERRTKVMAEQQATQIEHVVRLSEAISAETDEIDELIKENTELTKMVHSQTSLLEEIHQHVVPPPTETPPTP